jgi:outer membrane protein TolC
VHLLPTLSLFQLTLAAWNGTPVRLQEVRIASRENVAARLAQLTAEAAEERQHVALSGALPQAWLAGIAGYQWSGAQQTLEPSVSPDNPNLIVEQVFPVAAFAEPNFGFSLNVSQVLFDGGKWWNQIGLSREEHREAVALYDEARRTSELEGIRRFYELYRAQAADVVLTELAELSAEHMARAKGLAAAGLGRALEVSFAEVNLGSDRIAQTRSQARLALASASLAVWLNRNGLEALMAVAPSWMNGPPAAVGSLAEVWETAKTHRAVLQAVAARTHAAELAESVAAAEYWPTLSLLGTAGRAGPVARPVFTDPSMQNYATGALQLRWDFFSGFAGNARVAQARLARHQAELRQQQAEHEVQGELQGAWVGLQAQVAAADEAKLNAEAAKRAFDLARQHFQSGAGSTLEVRDAALKQSQAQLEAISTRIDVEIQWAALQRAMGASDVSP